MMKDIGMTALLKKNIAYTKLTKEGNFSFRALAEEDQSALFRPDFDKLNGLIITEVRAAQYLPCSFLCNDLINAKIKAHVYYDSMFQTGGQRLGYA